MSYDPMIKRKEVLLEILKEYAEEAETKAYIAVQRAKERRLEVEDAERELEQLKHPHITFHDILALLGLTK